MSAHATAQQLAVAIGATPGGAHDLPGLVQQAVTAVTAVPGSSECTLATTDRVAACKLLQQLLELPVDAVVVEPAMQQQPISDSGTQVLFQQVLSQLPGIPGLQPLPQQPGRTDGSGGGSSSLVQLVHQQQPAACLHLEQLLRGAVAWLQAAVQQDPRAAGGWPEGQDWQLGQLLVQLAATTVHQALQQQLSSLASSTQGDSSIKMLLLQLVDILGQASSAAAAQADAVGHAGVAAALSVMQQSCQLLQDCQQWGLLSTHSCQHVQQRLLQLVLPPAAAAGAWPDLDSPESALQATAAAAGAAGVQDWPPQRLQVLSLLLDQCSSSWEDLAGLLAADAGSGTGGWDRLLQLVLAVLQATAAAAADHEAAAATQAAAQQEAGREAATQESEESEPDYFQDIFGSDGAADSGGAAPAAASANSPPVVSYEQALSQLSVQLLRGLAAHLSGMAARCSSSGADTQWGTTEQRVLQLALCFIALPHPGPQDEQQGAWGELAGVQQAVQAAVQQVCICCVAAAQQLQDAVLLAPVAAGQTRSAPLMQLAAHAMMQHAALAASKPHSAVAGGAGAATAAAVSADPRRALLLSPWLHLATQLAVTAEAAISSSEGGSSMAQLQEQLAWLLCPGRLSLVLAVALAAPGPERSLMAAVMLHCLQRCSVSLASVPAGSGADPAMQAVAGSADAGSRSGCVRAHALALCSVHACLSTLLWLLLPPALLPTAWLQRHLQETLQQQQGQEQQADGVCAAAAARSSSSGGGAGAGVQLRQEPWPAGLAWVAALLQYKHETDELPVLLESLGVEVDGSAQEALAELLPGFIPGCLPGMDAADVPALTQQAVLQMQQEGVMEAAQVLLQQQSTAAGHEGGGWRCPSPGPAGMPAVQLIEQLLDSVLPAAAATWAVSEHNSSDVAAAVAHGCCQERALQLLLVLQLQPEQQGKPAAGFNMFGSYQHLVGLQQQLTGLLSEYEAALQATGSSSQLMPCRLSLQPSCCATIEQQQQQQQQQQQDQPQEHAEQAATASEQQQAVCAVADRLGAVLAAALADAVQRFQLCGSRVSPAMLLKQQLVTCCAEVELLGQAVQGARALLLPHLPKLLPLLSQLQWRLTDLQLKALAAALSCCTPVSSSSEGGVGADSPGDSHASSSDSQADSMQLLLRLCTDADYAADSVDAVHEGLGYCLLASLSEPQGQCWPSRADPAAAVAAAATTAAESEVASAVEVSAAQCVTELMQPLVPAQQQQQQEQTDLPLLVQELNLLHRGLPAVPLPAFWAVGSLNRASGSIAAAGAALAASAGAVGAKSDSAEQQPAAQDADPSPAAASSEEGAGAARAASAGAVGDWLRSMASLELQRPLLLRPLQLQHAHLLKAAEGLVAAGSGQPGGDADEAAAPAAAPAGVKASAEPRGVVAVLQDVSQALGIALASATAAADADGGDAAEAGMPGALAAAAVSRLCDGAEDAGGYLAPVAADGSATSSTAAELVLALVQQQQQQPSSGQQGSVLQQLWQCAALDVLDSSRVVDLVQQVTGAFHGSDDPQAQQVHDSFMQALQQALLQLPQQHFDRLLQLQLGTRDAFAAGSSGVCRELWQQLLAAGDGDSAGAVQLLQRLLAACLRLTFGEQTSSAAGAAGSTTTKGSSSGGFGKQHLAAVGLLVGVIVQCATALKLPGVLACLNSLEALAAAVTSSSSGGDGGRSDSVMQHLIPFLPLLLFVQRVVVQSSGGQGSSSGAGTKGSRATKKTSDGSSKGPGLAPGASQGSTTGPLSTSSTSSSADAHDAASQDPVAAQPQQQPQGAALGPAGASDASTAATVVLQDDAVQVLGGASASAAYDEDEDFLDEFEDEDEYLNQLLQHGALAAGGSSSTPAAAVDAGAAADAAAADAAAAGGPAAEGDGDASSSDSEGSSLGDGEEEEEYQDAEDGTLPAASSSSEAAGAAAPAPGSSADAATVAAGGAAQAGPAAAAGAAAVAAAAAAFGGLQAHGLGEAADEDEQALLDEEFAALLQELLSAGAAADVALAAVTAATGMAPPPAAVAVATEAAAASGDDEMVAVVEQLAAGAAAAAAAASAAEGGAGQQDAGSAATSLAASPTPAPARQAAASGREGSLSAGASGASSSSRHRQPSSSTSEGASSFLPQLRRYWLRTHPQPAPAASPAAGSSGGAAEELQCTYAVHGDQFVEQHWFQCYTCGLTDSRGCCSACVRICHAGHDVVYAARSRFFCDCGGENGPRNNAVACKCLSAVPVKHAAPDGTSSTSSSTGQGGGSSSANSGSLVQQGWLLPAARDPCACAGLAASLPDPLDAAWAFDPQLYPHLYAAASRVSSSTSSGSSDTEQQQGLSASALQQLLQCGPPAAPAGEQQAAALKLVPQGLVAKAAQALRPWLAADSSAAGADAAAQQQLQGSSPREVLQGLASSTLQMSQLLLRQLLQHSSLHKHASGEPHVADAGDVPASAPSPAAALPPVLPTAQLLLEGGSSSSSKAASKSGTGSSDKGSAQEGSSSSAQPQQEPLVELQRVIRLGNMSSSSSSRSRTRSSGSEFGSDSGTSSSRAPEVPSEVTAALEGGVVCQQSAAAARQGQLLAVCRGESVGLMDGRLLAAELCGKDIFTKEEISAAVAVTSKALSPNQPAAGASSSGGGAGSSDPTSSSAGGASCSYFYVRRHAAKFHVLALHWDLLQGRRLLVVGYDQAQVWSIEPRDLTISDRLVLQLPAQQARGDEAASVVLAASWLPDSDTWVAVTTPLRVCLFDLTHSAVQPAVVIEPQGHVLLSGGAAFVPRLVQRQQQQQQGGDGEEQQQQQQGQLCQRLYALLLTRDGQLLSAEVPQQLLDRRQSCASHWPGISCQSTRSSNGGAGSSSSSLPQGTSRSSSPGPLSTPGAGSSPAGPQVRPGSSGAAAGRPLTPEGGPAGSSGSSSGSGWARLAAKPVEWPADSPQLHVGRSCHWLQGNQLLVVAGSGRRPAAPAEASSSSSSTPEEQQQQLLLQLDATCSRAVCCSRWDTADAAVPIFGSPKPLVLSEAAAYWDLPLLPAARATYNAAQLFAVAPGQAKQLLQGTSSNGQGCAYIAGLMPGGSSGSGSSSSLEAVVQPLHLKHSSAGAVVDGIAVLSFPYTQQLLLVVLCSKGNMYMYASRRPPGLRPMQPFTQLLRQQLTQGADKPAGAAASTESGQQEGAAAGRSTAACSSDAQRQQECSLSKRAAAVTLATGPLPATARAQAAPQGAPEQAIVAADDGALLLQHSQNITSHLSVSGDISRAGTAEAAARALFKTLADPERRLEAPSSGAAMTLVLKIAPACELQPVGLKLLLPGGGVAPASVKVTCRDARSSSTGGSGGGGARPTSIAAIAAAARSAARAAAGAGGSGAASTGGAGSNTRTVQLAGAPNSSGRGRGRYQRWHQIIFTPEESAAAAAAGQVTLEFSQAVEPDKRAALCHLDMFGQAPEVVAARAKQQQEREEEQVLSVDAACAAAAAAVPAVLVPAAAQSAQGRSDSTPADPASAQLLLTALLQTSAVSAAALPASCHAHGGSSTQAAAEAAAAGSSHGGWQQDVVSIAQQLLAPAAQAAAQWTPSWQCEAATHALLAAASGSTGSSAAAEADAASCSVAEDSASAAAAAALAALDGWKLQQAEAVLLQFAAACSLLGDAAVFDFLHTLAQLQSVLQARPSTVVESMRAQHSSSNSGDALAACASKGLAAAVFGLKQLSSSPLLPAELLAPLTKTCVELWMAHAAAAVHTQQHVAREVGSQAELAAARAAHGLAGLLLNSDAQLRLHAAAAWAQACSSSSWDCSLQCAVFVAVARLLLRGQRPASCLLPACQAVAQVASQLLHPAVAQEGTQAVAQVVEVLVQQLAESALSPDTAEHVLLLQLLLAHILTQARQQQQQEEKQRDKSKQQPEKQEQQLADQPGSSSSSRGAMLSPLQVQHLASCLLATLQTLLPALQQQQQQQQQGMGGVGSSPQQSAGGAFTVVAGEGIKQPGPGGFPNYQALLAPPPAVSSWGISASCCSTFLGAASSSSGGSGVGGEQPGLSGWLLDPYLQGGRAGTRLLQALPLQLAAACLDTAHCLLQYGLVASVQGRAGAAAPLPRQPPPPATAGAGGGSGPSAAAAWRDVLCRLMDTPQLRPVRRLAKQLLLQVSGGSSGYREVRALHTISRHTEALAQALNLTELSCLQQQQQGGQAAGQQQQVVVEVVAALQGNWQQQSLTAACLAQLLSVVESQPVCWARVCCANSSSSSSSSSSSGRQPAAAHMVLPLLLQLALQSGLPQLSLPAVKLFNAALAGVVKGSSRGRASSSSSSSSSSGGKAKPAAAGASRGSSSSSRGSSSRRGADAGKPSSLGLEWLLSPPPQQQPQEGAGGGAQAEHGAVPLSLLSAFIDRCVVGWPEAKERKEAAKTLVLLHRALGVGGNTAVQAVLLQAVLAAVPAAGPAVGAASLQLYSAAGQLLKATSTLKESSSSSSSPDRASTGTAAAAAAGEAQQLWQCVSGTAGDLFATAAAAAAALAAHPCGLAYQQLQELTELQQPSSSSTSSSSSSGAGYWLELSACDVAGGRLHRKPPSSAVRLDSIAAELKYGDRQVMARLPGWYSVHKLLLAVHSPRRSKTVASLRLWYCDSPVSDLQQLKQQGPPALPPPAAAAGGPAATAGNSGGQPVWQLAAGEVQVAPGQTEVTVAFELPLLLSCLMVEFAGFHVSVNEQAAEVLHCPRCSHVVSDKHGLCSYCRENAYQCRQCRHINYEAPDAFICSECGHSRYGRFELLLQAVKAPGCPPTQAQANSDDALAALDAAAAAAASKAIALQQAATAVQQQAAALATEGLHHTPDAAAAAAAAVAGSGPGKRGSSAGGGSGSSTAADSLIRPGLKHLAELYMERCRPAYEDALQAARAHAVVRAAIAEAEASPGSGTAGAAGAAAGSALTLTSSSCAGAGVSAALAAATAAGGAGGGAAASVSAAAALFSRCSYGHISAVLSAAINLLRTALAAAPAPVTHAAREGRVLRGLLSLLAAPNSLNGLPHGAAHSPSPGSALVADVRGLLLGLAKADSGLHEQLLDLLQQQLLPARPAGGLGAETVSSSSSRSLSGHELQLLLMVSQHAVQHMPKELPAAASAAATQQARGPQLVLQLLQQAVAKGAVQGLWPELLLLPGLKVMAGAAAVQQRLVKVAAEQAAKEAAAAAAAEAEAAAAAAAAAAQQAPPSPDAAAAAADAALEVSEQQQPASAAAEGPDVLDATVLSDAEAERLEQLKIAEYLSKRGSSGSGQPTRHAPHTTQQQRLQRQRLQPAGYGQSPYLLQQQQPLQFAGSGELLAVQRSGSGGTRPTGLDALGATQQLGSPGGGGGTGDGAAAAAGDAGQTGGAAAPQQQLRPHKDQAAVPAAAAAKKASVKAPAVAVPEVVSLQELLLLAQQLLLHPHSIAVRKEAAALLLQLQPEPLTRLQQMQLLLPRACSALSHSTAGAAAVAGTELFALLMETVAELLVHLSKGSSSNSGGSGAGAGTGGADLGSPDSSTHQPQSPVSGADSTAAAAITEPAVHAALSGLLQAVCRQLVLQVGGLLQQEQQLFPDSRSPSAADAGAACTAALPMLLELIEQLLIGLSQLQVHHQQQHHHHHHHHHAHHHLHHHHHQQGGGEVDAGWVQPESLQQLLWAVGGLDALTAGRTACTQAAASQLHRLLRQGWLEGGGGEGAGTAGDSDDAGEDEEYTEVDDDNEYETEEEEEEGEPSEYPEGDTTGAGSGDGGGGAAAADGQPLAALPPLSEAVLAQRRGQLVEALVVVLGTELQRCDQQHQQPALQPSGPAAAAVQHHQGPVSATAAAGQDTQSATGLAGLSRRSSLAVCSALVVLLTSAVSPEKPAPSYQLLLEKAATQEEFIPGQLPAGGLVTSATLTAAAAAGGGGEEGPGGPLMRDVKNYICARLDMTGLIDDDFGMELLVGGSLISLALPVLDVIQHHWWPLHQQQARHRASAGAGAGAAAAAAGSSSGGSGSLPPPNIPMPVTFRLSGLDGEATEPQVKELNPGQAAGQNPDEENVLAGVLAHGQGAGLGLLLQLLLLAHQQPVPALRRVSGQLLQLLKAAVGQAACRQALLQQGALGCLLHLVHLACKPLLAAGSMRGAAGARAPAALGCGITGSQLLLLLECLQELVTDANRSGKPVNLGAVGAADAAPAPPSGPAQQQQQHTAAADAALAASGSSSGSSSTSQLVTSSSTEVAQLADGLSVLESVGLGSCAAVLAKLLTALAHHSSAAQLGLVKHFAPALDLQALDAAAAAAGADSTGSTADSTPAAAGEASGAAAAEAGGEEDAPLLTALQSEAGGVLSAQEHCLQLKGFLRLTEALSLSNASTTPSSSSAGGGGDHSQAQQEQPGQQQGTTADFQQLVLEQGLPARLAAYLLDVFTAAGDAGVQPGSSAQASAAAAGAPRQLLQPGTTAWSAAAARPGVPFALQLLAALAQGHAATASALAAEQPSLLQLLHLLEGTAGGATITPLAEACLEVLAGSGAGGVAATVASLRAATAAEMKARAARKRDSLLASMGMVQIEAGAEAGGGVRILPSPGGVPALSPLAAELAALEGAAEDDDGGCVCMVCREGYALQPATLLGCYCFCRVAAAAEWPGCAPPWGTPHGLLFTTVSHFNLIHVSCHAAAKAADASLRQPKREWQGATLRNGSVLCNSLLPLSAPGGGKAETAYAAAVTAFWQQQLSAPSSREAAAAAGSGGGGAGSGGGDVSAGLNVTVSLSRRSSALREADGSLQRVSLVAADLATLLWRFSAQLSFSEEARGGGRASNARLLFALLQLGRYYVVEAPSSDLKKALQLLGAAAGAGAALGLEAAAAAAAVPAGGSASTAGAVRSSSSSAGEGAQCGPQELAELVAHAPFVLALSLLAMGPTEWMAARRALLALAARAGVARTLRQAAAEGGSGGGASSSSHRRSSSGPGTAAAAAGGSVGAGSLSDAALYEAAAPMLRLFGYVDWLHQWAKPAVGLAAAASSSGSGSSSSSGWGGAMAQQLQDLKGCAEASGELLEVVGEAEEALGLQDLLDGLGLLGVALGPKSSSCEEFLRQAVAGL